MNFAKMHGLGNDFIVIENLNLDNIDYSSLAVKVCDRHFGVGADGILVVEKSDIADIRMNIINSDGSIAEMCGNGIRCFSKYIFEKNIVKKDIIKIETLAGVMVAELNVKDDVVKAIKIDMGTPKIDDINIIYKSKENNLNYKIKIEEREFDASTILMGVPHTVVYVDELDEKEIIKFGPQIENMAIYPHKTNVNFVEVVSRDKIKVKTWERGAGLTLACGTGSCASVVCSYLLNKTENKVEVELFGGKLLIEYLNDKVFMEGPAEFICEGKILL
ncbi:Diaminopimelate epimerase [Caloramator mitchellensis]|uniref:Diaminopimelate epimerase n=1 Tax=Caloramator mitchellensis TaxID=908809 RepID=A0A0R3K0J6_CALMK|nr:diaminopimelate epimerase [Caloramator mitchellensis]KRQ86916.1 Diaminopimelate epimerase [Caloramator mitchellensis]